MPGEYNQKEIIKILKELPEDVKETLFSEKTADSINNVCRKHGVPTEKISQAADCVGRVLLGILSLEELPEVLEKEAGLKKNTAQSVAQEIELSVFSQIKSSLKRPAARADTALPAKEEPRKPTGKDIYHEPVA